MVIDLLYASLTMPLVSCYIKSFRGVSRVARPEHGSAKMTAVWASYHEALCRDGAVAPHGEDVSKVLMCYSLQTFRKLILPNTLERYHDSANPTLSPL
jgi:hypothetical protein